MLPQAAKLVEKEKEGIQLMNDLSKIRANISSMMTTIICEIKCSLPGCDCINTLLQKSETMFSDFLENESVNLNIETLKQFVSPTAPPQPISDPKLTPK